MFVSALSLSLTHTHTQQAVPFLLMLLTFRASSKHIANLHELQHIAFLFLAASPCHQRSQTRSLRSHTHTRIAARVLSQEQQGVVYPAGALPPPRGGGVRKRAGGPECSLGGREWWEFFKGPKNLMQSA